MKKDVKIVISLCVSFLFLMSFFAITTAYCEEDTDFDISVIGDNCVITGCDTDVNGELIVPDTISGKTVAYIGQKAFSGCNGLTKIVLPEALMEIGQEAFLGCVNLTEVIMGDNVNKIGNAAFSGCLKLKHIKLSTQLKAVSGKMFYMCESLSEIDLPDGITSFGESSFSGCSNIKSITAPENLSVIFTRAFSECTSLEKIYLPSSLEYVNEQAFKNCNSIDFVYYEGEKSDFEKVGIEDGNTYLSSAEFVFSHKHPESCSVYTFEGTCSENGYIKYDCVCGFSKVTETVSSKSHEFDIREIVKESTCKTEGTERLSCINCSYCEEIALPLKKHIEVTDKAEKATCIKAGKTQGSHCDVCSEVIVSQNDIPALGHSFSLKIKDEKHCASKATYKKAARYYYTCVRCGEISKDKTFTGEKLVLGKVSKIIFSSTDNSVTLKWKKVKNARGYAIYRKTSNGKWKFIKRVRADSIKLSGLDSGSIYTYAIRAYVIEGKTLIYAKDYTALKTATKPLPPSKVSATQNNQSVKLKWSKVKGATGYRVYRYDAKNKKWIIEKSKTESCKLTVKNLQPGTNYRFAVKAYIDTGKTTVWSKKYKSILTCTKPESPVVKATSYKNSIKLEWDKVRNASGYVVYCSTEPNSGYKRVSVTKRLRSEIDGLKSGTTYYFKVHSYKNISGKNVFSYASAVKKVKTR